MTTKLKLGINLLLVFLILLDIALATVTLFFPEAWFSLFHNVPYVDPQGLLRRTGAVWAAFTLFQFIALLRWRTQLYWLPLVAGIRLTEVLSGWVYFCFTDSLTWFGGMSLSVAPLFNILFAWILIKSYLLLTPGKKLETPHIQGLLLSAYHKQTSAMYLFFSISETAKAKAWLREVIPRVTTGPKDGMIDRERNFSLNLAFTYQGLEKLGLGKDTLATFSRPFIEGMSEKNRARLLGDSPDKWEWGGAGHRIHVLLMLFGNNPETEWQKREWQEREWRRRVAVERGRAVRVGGLKELVAIESTDLPGEQEHFGFEDGIGQPKIAGYRPETHKFDGPGNVIKAGEFILGYENEYGQKTDSPTLQPPDTYSEEDLPGGDLGRNGTYLVLRQLAQDVAEFWKMLEEQCRLANGSPDRKEEEALAAKMIGRWKDGTPLAPRDHESYHQDTRNDFGYFEKDRHGYHCPLGAHIRRANPRDALLHTPKKSLTTAKRHRLLRRGRPYGPPIKDRYVKDKEKRGLVFITLDANIERQFEFVQHAWISSPNFAGLCDEGDPILGGRTTARDIFTIPKQPVRERRHGILSHITVKGGAYFFLPSVPALKYLGR